MTSRDSFRTTLATQRAIFTEQEIAYLQSQRLGRIATVTPSGRPRLVATGYAVSPERGTIELGGYHLAGTRRVQDIRVNPHVSFIVDDIDDTAPGWVVRGVEIRGVARLHESGTPSRLPSGLVAHGWMEITPEKVRSWGLD